MIMSKKCCNAMIGYHCITAILRQPLAVFVSVVVLWKDLPIFFKFLFQHEHDVIHFHLKLLTDVYSLVLLLPLHSQGLQPSPPQLGEI